ncbi:MAG: hypothetical protein M0Z48_04440 [Nitrospiraceae bacterium]|nr:hypothetical protein [Nitrospiraceae bacterium]
MQTMVKLFPFILAAIQDAEAFFGPGKGPDKQAHAEGLVNDALGAWQASSVGGQAHTASEIAPAISSTIKTWAPVVFPVHQGN